MKLFSMAVYDRGLVSVRTTHEEVHMQQPLDQEGSPGDTPGGLARRLSRLFDLKLNPATQKPYTYQEAADAINTANYRERSGELAEELRRAGHTPGEVSARLADFRPRSIITPQYIGQFVRGEKDNPSKLVMEHLAALFGIHPAYFFEESERSQELDSQLDLLAKLKESGVLPLARTAAGLSARSLGKVLDFATHIAHLEGHRPEDPEGDRPETGS